MAQTEEAAGKDYYGYLFEPDKKPTKILEALLRGVADHIRKNVGNTDERKLTPEKLASFYKAVGGNYDSLFVDVPHLSISWIYSSIGCQHTLQPTLDDFALPSVPALTTRGFVRWQSIEILLGPEEHVPFIQYCVKNWAIINPETGLPFPTDLPATAFPLVPDPEIEKWHDSCAEKLRQRSEEPRQDPRPDLPPRPKVRPYTHVRATRPSPRVETDYYDSRTSMPTTTRPFIYKHVDPVHPERPILSHSPTHRARQFLAPEDSPRLSRSRRRSYPENLGSPVVTPPIPDISRPLTDPEHQRRHSHAGPRRARRGSVSSDASSEDENTPPSPRSPIPSAAGIRRRAKTHSSTRETSIPRESVRYMTPATAPQISVPKFPDPSPHEHRSSGAAAGVRVRERERESRHSEDREEKRRSLHIPIDIAGKLSAPFLLGKRRSEREREREGSRNRSGVRWKDLDRDPALVAGISSGGRKLSRSEEELERGVGRGGRDEYKRRDRERDRDGGSGRERDRPRMDSRRSSHEDVGRRDRERDRADRERDRSERERGSGEGGSRSFRDRERERDRERIVSPVRGSGEERERERERRRHVSPIRGVDGRRYPAHSSG